MKSCALFLYIFLCPNPFFDLSLQTYFSTTSIIRTGQPKMVKHIVTFKLTGTDDERRNIAQQFKVALEQLPSQIDVLQSMEVGINENPAEKWDMVLCAVVPTMADVVTYANHPAHLSAASLLTGHIGERACVDYEFNA